MSLVRGWAILMEFLAFLGVLQSIGCPIVLLVLQFSILGRQREMMDLLTGLMGDVRRELREGRRDRGEAGEPMRAAGSPRFTAVASSVTSPLLDFCVSARPSSPRRR